MMYRIYITTINNENSSSMSEDVTDHVMKLEFSSDVHLPSDMIDFLNDKIIENNDSSRLYGSSHPYAREAKRKSRGDASQMVVDFLNDAWNYDPVAMRMILVNLVRVNDKLASDTRIICQEFEGEYAMSALGLINGIMDVLDLHLIASRWSNVDDDTGSHNARQFMGFQIFKHQDINEFDQS